MHSRIISRVTRAVNLKYLLVIFCLLSAALFQTSSVHAQSRHQVAPDSRRNAPTLVNPDNYNIILIENFEADNPWPDVTLDNETVYTGRLAGRWRNHVQNPTVKLEINSGLGITNDHNFQFWLYSDNANGAEVNLIVEPENAGSYLQNYYIHAMQIDWRGWRFFNLSVDDFVIKGTPASWSEIERIRFTTSGWGNSPQANTDLTFDDIQFTPRVIELAAMSPQVDNANTSWTYILRLKNNTGEARTFDISLVPSSFSNVSATLRQNQVAVSNGQFKDVAINATLLDQSRSGHDLMPDRRIQVNVRVDNYQLDATEIAVFPPLPPHPRLYIQAGDIPNLQNRYTHSDLALVKSKLEAQLQKYISGISSTGRAEKDIRRSIEARAFLYLINQDRDAGHEAVNMMLEFLGSINKKYRSVREARDLYDSVGAAAMVYDWCYDLLSASERVEMIEGIKKVAGLSEFGWPITDELTFLTGFYSEHSAVALLAAGIAIFDEDPEMFTKVYTDYITGLAPSRNGYYPMGKHHQGTSYAASRFFHEAHSTFLFDAIEYDNIYVAEQAQVPYHTFYARTPSGMFLTEGDIADPANMDPRNHFIMAQLTGDPYLMNDGLRVARGGRFWRLEDAARTMLFWDPTIASRPLEELPTARYFPSPSGSIVARTGWGMDDGVESGVAIASMNIGEYDFSDHDHLDSGHFGIYYKGTLALDSGVYEGSEGSFNSLHAQNYYRQTIAHNALLIEDPNEPLGQYYGSRIETRDGGQYRPNRGYEWTSIDEMFSAGKRAHVLAHEIGAGIAPEYTYLKGEMAPGYNAPAHENYPPKVEEVKRSFVFFDLKNNIHPAALVVFDRVTSTNPAFKKKWLLHSVQRPDIVGSRISVTRTDDGHNGRLVNDVLLPASDNQQIERVGGPGLEFWVDGRNYDNNPPRNENVEPGSWRIELSPMTNAGTDHFLNVMHVMDANGGPAPLSTTKLESPQMIGAQIADRAVFFSKSGQPLNGQFSLNVPQGPALIKVLVTDLEPGEWSIQTANGTQSATATRDGQSIYFSAAPGSYSLSKDVVKPVPTATPNQPATPIPLPTIVPPTPTPIPTEPPTSEILPLTETFDGISGLYDGIGGWQSFRSYIETNPTDDVDHAMSLSGKNAMAQKSLPIGIEQGTTGTLHFRIRRSGDADIFVGLSDLASATDFTSFEVQFGAQFGPFGESSPDTFAVRSGDRAISTDGQFLVDEWYCVWLVIDNTLDQYQAYIKGSDSATTTQLSTDNLSSFSFRNGTQERLQTLYARTGYESAKVYLDDIYITPNAVNLDSPTDSCREQSPLQPTPIGTPTQVPPPVGTPFPTTTPAPTTPTPTGGSGTVLPPPTSTPAAPNPPVLVESTVTGRVFVDSNGNGHFDLGESGIEGMIVILIDLTTSGQTVTITTATDQEGIYRFHKIPEADYILSFAAPIGYSMRGGNHYTISTSNGGASVPDLAILREAPSDDLIYLPMVTQ